MTEIPTYLPGAQPRFYRGNAIGCLIVHGFMAAPPETAWLGESLIEKGYTVYVPRLTGHGVDHRHMTRMHWQDWYMQVLDSYYVLRQQCERVFVMGHSMGGLLSLMLAAQEDLDGLVIAASPMKPASPLMQYGNVIGMVRTFLNFPSEPALNAVIEAEQERRGEPIHSRIHYAQWAAQALRQLHLAIEQTQTILAQVDDPILMIYAENDTTVPISDLEILREAINSTDATERVLDTGGHLIYQDVGREDAFEAVSAWLAARV